MILLVLLIGGFFRSLQFTAVNALGYSDIDQRRMSRATSMMGVAQQVSLSVGVSIGALTLETSLRLRGGTELAVQDFTPAFIVVGAGVGAVAHLVPALAAGCGRGSVRPQEQEARRAGSRDLDAGEGVGRR